MITARIFGGLGNQMFQYAAAAALARRHDAELRLELVPAGRPYVLDKLRIAERAEVPSASGFVTYEKAIPAGTEPGISGPEYLEPFFQFDEGFFSLKPPVILHGYWQSERYFTAIGDEIREIFQPVQPLSEGSRAVADAIRRAPLPISVHIRQGDYVQSPSAAAVHGVLGADHYARAWRLMEGLVGPYGTAFVFSDEPDKAEALLECVPRERRVVVRENTERPWEDMALMALCKHHIIANSSFSWWGAWLNPNPDKTVIGPRAWFSARGLRTRNICDLIPDGWILT